MATPLGDAPRDRASGRPAIRWAATGRDFHDGDAASVRDRRVPQRWGWGAVGVRHLLGITA